MATRWLTKRVWVTALVIVLGVWLAWLDPRGPSVSEVDPEMRREEPGHVLENAELALFGESGTMEQLLITPHLVHTPQQGLTEAATPRATLYDADQRQWLASADRGVLQSERQTLVMEGSARLLAPDEGWQLDTERLHYDGQNRHVYTEAPALLQQPPQQMSATRMDVWLDDSQVRLTDNVRGTHPPARSTPQE